MRYFLKLKYLGTHFVGWQNQPNGITVQGEIEKAITLFLQKETPIVGCGRTDAGVHASCYYAHFDAEIEDAALFLYKINRIVGPEISIDELIPVSGELHARYNARKRRYHYYLSTKKDPFKPFTQYTHPSQPPIDLDLLDQCASLIGNANSFEAFCKTGSDVSNYLCTIHDCSWVSDEDKFIFTIAANRFLRGMVRLIVGACINVASGKIALAELENSLTSGRRLDLNWSVPAQGLFLSDVQYPKFNTRDSDIEETAP